MREKIPAATNPDFIIMTMRESLRQKGIPAPESAPQRLVDRYPSLSSIEPYLHPELEEFDPDQSIPELIGRPLLNVLRSLRNRISRPAQGLH